MYNTIILSSLLIEDLGVAGTLTINVSDTTVTSENVIVFIPILVISTSDTTTTSESVTIQDQEGIYVTDTTTTSENVKVIIYNLLINTSDTTVTSESATVGNPSINVSDTEGPATESVTVAIQAPATAQISVSDTTVTSQNLTIGGTEYISVSETTVTSENIYYIDISGYIHTLTTSDTTVTSENVVVAIPAFVLPYDAVTTVARTGQITISVSRTPAYNFTIKTGAI